MRQGWGICHCEYDVQGNRRLSPVASIVVFVCVVLNALRVNTNKRAFNTCVCLHPTGLRGNSIILHTVGICDANTEDGVSAQCNQLQEPEVAEDPDYLLHMTSSIRLSRRA